MRKILCLSLLTVFVLTILAAAFGCGPGTTQTTTNPPSGTTTTTPGGTTTGVAEYTVDIGEDGVTPQVLTIPAGSRVTWFNKTTRRWYVSSVSKVPDTGVIAAGSRMSYTFKEPGSYEYFNIYDKTQTGTVIVE
jgi:plastocyanin